MECIHFFVFWVYLKITCREPKNALWPTNTNVKITNSMVMWNFIGGRSKLICYKRFLLVPNRPNNEKNIFVEQVGKISNYIQILTLSGLAIRGWTMLEKQRYLDKKYRPTDKVETMEVKDLNPDRICIQTLTSAITKRFCNYNTILISYYSQYAVIR